MQLARVRVSSHALMSLNWLTTFNIGPFLLMLWGRLTCTPTTRASATVLSWWDAGPCLPSVAASERWDQLSQSHKLGDSSPICYMHWRVGSEGLSFFVMPSYSRRGAGPTLPSVVTDKGWVPPQHSASGSSLDICMAFGGNTGLEFLGDPRCHRITDPDMTPSSLEPDVPMASGGSTGHPDQHVSSQQHCPQTSTWSLWLPRPWTSSWPLVVTQVIDIITYTTASPQI